MKKLNKKGFTLIEMLVVIAIIAILVAIIVPTVSKANAKAAAATNAANLRTYAAELAIAELNEEITITDSTTATDPATVAAVGSATAPTVPTLKSVGNESYTSIVVYNYNGTITCAASTGSTTRSIEAFGAYAEDGAFPTTPTGTTGSGS